MATVETSSKKAKASPKKTSKSKRNEPKPPPTPEVIRMAEKVTKIYPDIHFPPQLPDDFELLSTIRYDPKLTMLQPMAYSEIVIDNFFLLQDHIDRLKYTIEFFQHIYDDLPDKEFEITGEFLCQQLITAIQLSEKPVFLALKIRLLMKLTGEVRIEVHDTPYRGNLLDGIGVQILEGNLDLPSLEDNVVWDVYIDKTFTLISAFTSFKTTTRQVYTEARQRTLPGLRSTEEVLMYNPQSNLTEGSITNIAIKDLKTGHWVTPLLSSGCLCGVMRSFLLRKGFIRERLIKLNEITIGQEILLFNGIMGVVKGKIVG
ncbi:putative 4-amino-4-deoxychorismate lyase [Scheffersomyces coipomensis]|uniref:putative 4-amino-4-deoxychorismate lyase n=1 Tax=Scheffersomyces coipomensis TaxID=1788519 RepID=UPI00315D3D87